MKASLSDRSDSDAIFRANDSADLMSSSSCFLLLLLNWDIGDSRDRLPIMNSLQLRAAPERNPSFPRCTLHLFFTSARCTEGIANSLGHAGHMPWQLLDWAKLVTQDTPKAPGRSHVFYRNSCCQASLDNLQMSQKECWNSQKTLSTQQWDSWTEPP